MCGSLVSGCVWQGAGLLLRSRESSPSSAVFADDPVARDMRERTLIPMPFLCFYLEAAVNIHSALLSQSHAGVSSPSYHPLLCRCQSTLPDPRITSKV